MSQSQLRNIPSVGSLIEHPRLASLAAGRGRDWLLLLIQKEVAAERSRLRAGTATGGREELREKLVARILARREAMLGPAMRRVINATGVVVHTNLGRSVYPVKARQWLLEAAAHPLDLEMDLESGRRGHRGRRIEEKLALLAGAEDALIVNNNAAALWLAVRSLAGRGRVILSRGEIVAIGGSFRLNEILDETGCELVEVGTTNRTSLDDYRDALAPGAVVLKVHRSNFAMTGFSEDAGLGELGAMCRETGHDLIYDAGSGLLRPLEPFGLAGQETLVDDVSAGATVITCSGDKLLGGMQAGFAIGRGDVVDGMRSHPLRRVLRVDKTTLAACDAVLTHYLAGDDLEAVPTLALLARPVAELEAAAEKLKAELDPHLPEGWTAEIVEDRASVGGGSFSDAEVPTRLLRWRAAKEYLERSHVLLRRQDPAVLARIGQDGLALDFRSMYPEDMEPVRDAMLSVWKFLSSVKKDQDSKEKS